MVWAFFCVLITQNISAQKDYQKKIDSLQSQRSQVEKQEKEALKLEIGKIDNRLSKKEITTDKAIDLKQEEAQRRALNIENRVAIIDNEIALLERNHGDVLALDDGKRDKGDTITIKIPMDNLRKLEAPWDKDDQVRYDRRTYSDFVIAFGLNNTVKEGESLNHSPYNTWGSQFLELGWQWRTRVFESTNFMRFHYGFAFQFNNLKPDHNQYFITDGNETLLQDYPYQLSKSKFHMGNLVFPLHLEFGPSKVTKSEDRIRYSIDSKFRVGLGGYGGFNFKTRQKLKYYLDGDKIKEKHKGGYNSSDFIYGVSGYVGFGCAQLYVKYDLNTLFKDNQIEEHNISMGVRFTL